MKFNTYKNKKQTSDKIMRQVKREQIFSYLIAGVLSSTASIQRSFKTPEGMKRKEMPFKEANMTSMYIYFDTEEEAEKCISIIDSSGWLPTPNRLYNRDKQSYCLFYESLKKLRLYYDWTHRGKDRQFYIGNVMKYMFSSLLLKHLLRVGVIVELEDKHVIKLSLLDEDDIAIFQSWLKEVHSLESTKEEKDLFVDSEELKNILNRELD